MGDLGPPRKAKDSYHHGDLRRALVVVATDLLSEKGVSGFSLRGACRQAGVTIGAAVHHFGSSRGLLTAVAVTGFERLCAAFEDARDDSRSPVDQLIAAVEGYVALSRSMPGPFSIMFRWDLLDKEDPKFLEVGPRSHALLTDLVGQAALATNSEQDILFAADTLWATIHGFVDLGLLESEPPGDTDRARGKVDFAVHAVVEGMVRSASKS